VTPGNGTRPKRNQRSDKNHKIVSSVIRNRCGGYHLDAFGVHHACLRGLRVVGYDTSGPGGEMVDWMVLVSWLPVFFEVKQEREFIDASRLKLTEAERLRGMLKPGEIEFLRTCPAVTMIVTTEEQVYTMLNKAADFVMHVEEISNESADFLRLFFPKLGADFLYTDEEKDENANSRFTSTLFD
jgi:hypothetical protein